MAAAAVAVATAPAAPSAGAVNVALGKPVTITGEVGVITCCWPDATVFPPAPLSSIVDGLFLPAGTEWQTGTVWWDEANPGSLNNIIEIDLGGLFPIRFVSIQADNNDSYAVSYRDQFDVWQLLGTAGPFGGPGMQIRSGTFFPPFEASAFRIDAFGGDGFYSVSEFQAVPEPTSLALVLIALALFSASVRARAARRGFVREWRS